MFLPIIHGLFMIFAPSLSNEFNANCSDDYIVSDLLHDQTKKASITPKRTTAPPKPRRSEILPAQSAPTKRRSQSQSATETGEENAASAYTLATTPSIVASGSKRKRAQVADSDSGDEPRAATKRRDGRNRPSQDGSEISKTASEKGMKEDEDETVWEVERVVGARIEANTYIHWYQVKWKGWAAKHNTWEPKKNLSSCRDLIEEFEKLANEKAKYQDRK